MTRVPRGFYAPLRYIGRSWSPLLQLEPRERRFRARANEEREEPCSHGKRPRDSAAAVYKYSANFRTRRGALLSRARGPSAPPTRLYTGGAEEPIVFAKRIPAVPERRAKFQRGTSELSSTVAFPSVGYDSWRGYAATHRAFSMHCLSLRLPSEARALPTARYEVLRVSE